MTKSVLVLAVLAAAVSTSAVAKDLKQNKQAVSATQMTNSEMDKVTAGRVAHAYAWGQECNPAWNCNLGNGPNPNGVANGHNK
jgi:opacity protein-like surface antigen